MATGHAAGVEVTIYNPALDPDGTAGAALAEVLVRGLGGVPSATPAQPGSRSTP